MYARIENDEVQEIIDFNPDGEFHPSLVWVKFDGRKNVKEGDIYKDGEFRKPDIDIEAERNEALMRIDREANNARYHDRSYGETLDDEYAVIERALREYRDHPDGKTPLAVAIHAEAFGVSVETAARDIAEAAAFDEDRLMAVRRIRLKGKRHIESVESDFAAEAEPYIQQLQAMR